MDLGVSALVVAARLKNKKGKTLPALLMPSDTEIICLFMENDFMYLLDKRLESGDTPGLFEGGFVLEGRCSSP